MYTVVASDEDTIGSFHFTFGNSELEYGIPPFVRINGTSGEIILLEDLDRETQVFYQVRRESERERGPGGNGVCVHTVHVTRIIVMYC